ncbi:G/U mismatch-specific DNA glycosylase [Paraburkholderia metrosideri]|jgi:TDG/mug DNA glycosylase family protein|uniref:G/U mismatch-specific DNA glycosylase n=1 Tax=Paraburkholderia metrosideri TaxID=580937 RepID=A0ABN7I5F3_9BURK|nr:G/U mismatch-specific DNA glycosylase [Paraburkholderia metrosideri]CAD6553709.1 G/U mismatch-specific DNA glycosylase [Paraburkholderia metrosideri]
MSETLVTSVDTGRGLPDLLAPGLSVVFCGINPGVRAASTGHHFEGRGNRFWRVLHLAGFTPELIRPEDDRTILRYGCGLTTVVARATAQAAELSREEIEMAGATFRAKISHYAPHHVVFLGKMAISALSGSRDIQWGPQVDLFGGVRAWVVPNPSGLNRAFDLAALVTAYREVRTAVVSMP